MSDAEVGLLRAMAYRIGLTLDQAQRSVQLEQIVRTGREIARHLDQAAVEPLAFELPDLCPMRALLAVPVRRDEWTQALLCAMRFSTTLLHARKIEAIVTSGYANDPVMSQYARHGFSASLHKPFGMMDLRKAMEAALAR